MFDQYLNYISLEDEMFTVRNQDRDSISYYGENVLQVIEIAITIFAHL